LAKYGFSDRFKQKSTEKAQSDVRRKEGAAAIPKNHQGEVEG
jgi:hypothetical protein